MSYKIPEYVPTIQPLKEALKRLPHKTFDRAQLVLFQGRREQGKTFGLRAYMESREPRVLAFDPFQDFHGLMVRNHWQDALDDMAEGGPCRRRIIPPINNESRQFAELFFEACIDQLRDCLLVLDEMSLWSEARETASLRTLVLQGRRLGLRMAIACQRIALVPGVLLSEVTEMVIFKTTRPRDLETLATWGGKKAAEIAPILTQGRVLLLKL